MTSPDWPTLAAVQAIANHLWQSTLVVALAALAATFLRKDRAQVRYALWLAASMKFLVPLAALVALGRRFAWYTLPAAPAPEMTFLLNAVGAPFSSGRVAPAAITIAPASPFDAASLVPLAAVCWALGTAVVFMAWARHWRRVSALVRVSCPLEAGREVDVLRSLEAGRRPLPIVASDNALEPGVFGIVRPVLVWPRQLTNRLSDSHLASILAHELAHARRRDNLAAALHTIVQAIFWFHPLAWWLGARLMDEREHACDEEVLLTGSEPRVYAEGLLKTCEFSIAAPAACMAGVNGADLAARIERILTRRVDSALRAWKKALLFASASLAAAAPLAIGLLGANADLRAQSAGNEPALAFEVATIKVNTQTSGFTGGGCHGTDRNGGDMGGGLAAAARAASAIPTVPLGRCVYRHFPLTSMMAMAYDIPFMQSGQVILGGPDWIRTERFDVEAKSEEPTTEARMKLMMRTLLAGRFKLALHRETREAQGFGLVVARGGPKMQKATGNEPRPGIFRLNGSPLTGQNVSVDELARFLSLVLGRPINNESGLAGTFNFTLTWTPGDDEQGLFSRAQQAGAPGGDADGPSIYTALQEQLGLRLDTKRVPREVFVVDRAERPTEN